MFVFNSKYEEINGVKNSRKRIIFINVDLIRFYST